MKARGSRVKDQSSRVKEQGSRLKDEEPGSKLKAQGTAGLKELLVLMCAVCTGEGPAATGRAAWTEARV